jgi:hypothetical protein
LVILDDGPDERRATMVALRGFPFADLAVDHQHPVGWAFLVTGGNRNQGGEDNDDRRGDKDQEFKGHIKK